MRRLLVLSVLVVTFALGLAACGGGGGADVDLSEADAGKTIDAAVGDSIVISLDGNPTTGFSWNPMQPQSSDVVALKDKDFEASSDAIGAGGTEKVTYEAAGAGEATIELGYFQPWEPGKVDKTFTVTIKVS